MQEKMARQESELNENKRIIESLHKRLEALDSKYAKDKAEESKR
jgi:hypothetical protein